MEPVESAEAIVLNHVAYAMGAALVPLPLVDVAAVTLVQLDMVRRLAEHYRVASDGPRVEAAVLSLVGASAARVGASVVKALPGGGWVLGGATQVVLSGAATWALGEVYRQHFEDSGSLDDVDFDALRERYRGFVARGREIARGLRDHLGPGEVGEPEGPRETLDRLARLRSAGAITEEEYRRLRELEAERL